MSVSTRMRFEILKRDGFRCTYCGADSAAAKLHVDHVVPVAGGGTDDPVNLVTACDSCNLGKSAVPLDEHSRDVCAVAADVKQRAAETADALAEQARAINERGRVVGELAAEWEATVSWTVPKGVLGAIPRLVDERGAIFVLSCIQAVAQAKDRIDGGSSGKAKYFFGVVRNKSAEHSASAPSEVARLRELFFESTSQCEAARAALGVSVLSTSVADALVWAREAVESASYPGGEPVLAEARARLDHLLGAK